MPSDAKDREYAELGRNLVQLAAAMEETVQLMEFVRADLQAMASIGANTASQLMATVEIMREQIAADNESVDGSEE